MEWAEETTEKNEEEDTHFALIAEDDITDTEASLAESAFLFGRGLDRNLTYIVMVMNTHSVRPGRRLSHSQNRHLFKQKVNNFE